LRWVGGGPFYFSNKTTGFDLRQEWAADMNQMVQSGWGKISPDRFQLTRQGLRFADAAAELFLR
jgi:coproporphyrinogen III oxidase-like Fe-S oxidoreductase